MIFLPSCSIHVSSDLQPAETHGSTVLPVKPKKDIPRFVRNNTIIHKLNIFCVVFSKHATYYASGSVCTYTFHP